MKQVSYLLDKAVNNSDTTLQSKNLANLLNGRDAKMIKQEDVIGEKYELITWLVIKNEVINDK